MIVYGDPEFVESGRAIVAEIRETLGQASRLSLDPLRTLLIRTGQLEQAIHDASDHAEPSTVLAMELSQRATDLAAAAFYTACASIISELPRSNARVSECLAALAGVLEKLDDAIGTRPLRVKVTEGFEFYALFPEQYLLAAARWAARHFEAGDRWAVVIGVRSIGTALSAAVRATLEASGWTTHRFTVRPYGHPYDRKISLPAEWRRGAAFALVVDEGPGLSGSSLAAVVTALIHGGMPIENVALLPGNDRGPGPAASPEVHAIWRKTARWFVPLHAVRWNGHSLTEALAENSAAACTTAGPVSREGHDLSGGVWRRTVFGSDVEWPAAATLFERTKYRCGSPKGQAVLWKFAGLGALRGRGFSVADLLKAAEQTETALTPRPSGSTHGFVAWPWQIGSPLTASHGRDSTVLDLIAHYLADNTAHAPEIRDIETAFQRAAEMLYWNAKEALGEAAAKITRAFADGADPACAGSRVADARMAPHEWIRSPAGVIVKTDRFDHVVDHTVAGGQPLLWDVAGTFVEWQLAPAAGAHLLAQLNRAGIATKARELQFYTLAYAAFRMGKMKLTAETQASDTVEQARCVRAYERYRETLEHLLRYKRPG